MSNKIKNFIEKFKKSAFWKSIATLSIGQIFAQIINLISIPIISRIYSKDAFGSFGIVTSTATLIIGFIGMGIGSAIMVPQDDEESKKIFRTGILLQFILATIFLVVLNIISPYYKCFNVSINYNLATLIMYVHILLTVLSSYLYTFINKLNLNKILFLNPIINSLGTLIITIPMGLLGIDSVGMFLASIISSFIIIIHMLTKINPFNHFFSIKEIKFVFKKYKKFILYQYPSNLMGTFAGEMPNQFISRNFGNTSLGDFSMCNKVISMPASLIGAPITNVYFRTAAEKFRENKIVELADLTFNLITKLMAIAFIPIVLGMIFAEKLFGFVLGSQWNTAGLYAMILAPQYLLSFCYNCVTYCRVSINKQQINLFTTLLQFFMIITALCLGAFVFKSMLAMIICFAVSNFIFQICNLTINFICMKKNALKFILFVLAYFIVLLLLVFIFRSIINI